MMGSSCNGRRVELFGGSGVNRQVLHERKRVNQTQNMRGQNVEGVGRREHIQL